MNDSTNGRTSDGRFAEGHGFSKGNPHAKRVAEFRARLLAAVEADLDNIIGVLLDKAKAGEPWAVKEVLDRALGKPTTPVAVDKSGGMGIDEAFMALWGIKIPDETGPGSAFRS